MRIKNKTMKICKMCKEEKELSQYYKKTKENTVWATCKSCTIKRNNTPRQIKKGDVMNYKDYLHQAGLTDYYKKTLRYQI